MTTREEGVEEIGSVRKPRRRSTHPAGNPDRGSDTGQRNLKSTATYVAANALQRALAFILLPLYTHALSPTQYGQVSLILTVSAVLGFALTAGIDISLLRVFFQMTGDEDGQKRFIDSLWAISTGLAAVGSMITLAVVLPFLVGSSAMPPTAFALGIAGTAVLVAATSVPLAYLRALQRLGPYILVTASSAVVTPGLMLILVVGAHFGTSGWLLAVLIGNGAAMVAAARIMGWQRPRPFARPAVRAAFALGIPLIPHAMAQWSLLLADRLVLASITTVRDVGIYSLAGAIATPALVFVQAVNQGFAPLYAAAGASIVDRPSLQRSVTHQVTIVIVFGLACAALGPSVVGILVDRRFAAAGSLVPWLVVGYVFLGLYYVPVSGVALAVGKTKYLWPFSIGAALVNVLLLYTTVPRYGLMAAAVASAIGYAAMFVSISIYARRHESPISYDWSRLLRVVAVGSAAYTASVLTTSPISLVGAIERLAWVAGGALLALRVAGVRLPQARLVRKR